MRSRARTHKPAALFAALGDETRLWLVARLCDSGPTSIKELTEGSELTRQAVTKHLRVMERARLVQCRRSGRETVWTLEEQPLAAARQYLEMVSRQWDGRLARLRKLVEE